MLNTPFSPWPAFSQEEATAIAEVLLSNKVNYWTGTECRLFEKEFANWVGCNHAVALANGTLALEAALRALKLQEGDEVVISPRSFFASASSVVAVGATPVFADVDRNTQALSAETIRPVLTPRTKAVVVVHLAGMPAEMDQIMSLAEEHDLYVIEDCAQAHGALYKGRSVGSIGHIGAWSFCQDKIMSTGGEGGMVTTNDEELWSRMWSYKDHGKSWNAVYEREHPRGFRWLHESFGSNWRLTEMQGAIGRIQLRKLETWLQQRTQNAMAISSAVKDLDSIQPTVIPEGCVHAYYKYYLFVNPAELAEEWTRDRIVQEISSAGVPCYQGSCSEVYMEKAVADSSFAQKKSLPVAKELGENSLMFLVHPTLTKSEIEKTCSVIRDVILKAQK